MNPKQIENKYYKKLCEVFAECYSGAVEKYSTTMKDASLDDNNKYYVYNYDKYDMVALKLDDVSRLFSKEHLGYAPSAVDAVCIDSDNNWFLIEFKNSQFSGNTIQSIKKKMLSSLWFLLYTYSITENISHITENLSNNDIVKFAREHITYIVVCSYDKNVSIANNIHNAEATNEHYTPKELKPYVNYYFKDVYLYTQQELRKFIVNFK